MNQWIIAIGFAVVYLAISFALNAWQWSWVVWAAYAGYRLGEAHRARSKK